MIATFIPPDKLGTPPMSESPWALLPTASNHAAALDTLYVFITILCVISMILIIGAQLYFMVKYKKRSDDDRTSPITHNTKLEIGWSVIPSLFLIVIFVWGEVQSAFVAGQAAQGARQLRRRATPEVGVGFEETLDLFFVLFRFKGAGGVEQVSSWLQARKRIPQDLFLNT